MMAENSSEESHSLGDTLIGVEKGTIILSSPFVMFIKNMKAV